MRPVIFVTAVLIAGVLGPATAEAADACAPTPENAKDRLRQTGGDPVWALREWRAICPSEAMVMRYADEIGKANGGQTPESSKAKAPQDGSLLKDLSPDQSPTPREAKPVGTFFYASREDDDDGSGFSETETTVTIREDGIAEVKERYKSVAYRGWVIHGCESGVRTGDALLVQDYRVTIEGSTVSFARTGPTELKRKEPACWDLDSDDYFYETWKLTWKDGRLTTDSGKEYVKQKY